MKEKTWTYAGTIIIVVLLITTSVAFISNAKNKRNYKEEKLRNETVSQQNQQVSQELDKVKGEMAALTTKKESEDKEMAQTESRLTKTENRIAYISKENSSLMKDKDELAQLQKSKSDLDKVFEDMKLKQETASSRIKELENSAILLDAQKKELSGKLADAEKYRTDNVQIYGLKGNKNEKVTFLARRAKKLHLSFDIPQNLTEAISFKIITPSGTTISPENKSISWLVKPDSGNLTASLSSFPGEFDASRKVALTYTPKEKLKKGEYMIQIYSNDKNIGNCRLRLR